MRAHVSSLWLAAVVTALGACGSPAAAPPPAPPKAPVAAAPQAPQPETATVKPAAMPAVQVPKYEPKGRRDPFVTLEQREGPGGLTVASTKLTGVVRNNGTRLALVEAPDGIGYILKPGDTLGDGRVVEIGSDSVVFSVVPKPGAPSNRVTLRLATN